MYFRACRKMSCSCCSLGFVVGGTLTVVLVLHVMESYTAKKDLAGVTQLIAGYSSTLAHSLLSEAFKTVEGQSSTVQSEATIERRTSEISETSLITNNKEKKHMGCGVFDGKRSCYFLSLTGGSFDEMTEYCKEHNMQMVVLESWLEYKFLADQIKRDNMAMNIRVSMKLVSGHYTWIYPDGDTVQLNYGEQNPWAPNQPRYILNQDCVNFYMLHLGKLDDFKCSYDDRVTICEDY